MFQENPILNFAELFPNPGTIIGLISSCFEVNIKYFGCAVASIYKGVSKSCTLPPRFNSIQ